MFGVKEVKEDFEFLWADFNFIGLVIVVTVDVLYFGVFVEDEHFSLVCAMYGAIVPKRGESFVMIRVKMGQEMDIRAFWKGFGKVKVVD